MIFRLRCGGCGASPSADEPLPFRCPNFGSGDVDHVLAREGMPSSVQIGDSPNPFLRFRRLSFSYDFAISHGLDDAEYCELVEGLDAAVARVDGRGFRVTPLIERDGLFIKDETENVAGSHKGRHLMGIAIQLEVAARLGTRSDAPLAIASCGNAALAASVVARAAGRRLLVFVTTTADAEIVERLQSHGAEVTRCPRQPGVAGDPSYLAFRAAVADGAIPFTCQGGDNGLTLDGGRTLGYELAQQLSSARAGQELRLFIQVGGGALASATFAALRDAVALGKLPGLPQLFAVQTRGGSPLARAWERLQAIPGGSDDKLAHAARHRSQFMWPWEEEPKSIAHGILDDETYDWLAIARGMLESGGEPLVVSEDELQAANRMGRDLGIAVDHTGSAGLAGALQRGPLHDAVVLFTGSQRAG
jgi:threonine synthase